MSRRSRTTFVYFIKPIGLDGPIKIGCSYIPDNRLINLTIWSPFRLELIGSVLGTPKDERFLHRCFAHWHSHGEWFHPVPGLMDAVRNILEKGIPYAREHLKETGDPRAREFSADTRAKMSASMSQYWARRKQREAEKAAAAS